MERMLEHCLLNSCHSHARNEKEMKLLSLFTETNSDNHWIDARTAACYMFERNDPSSTQISRAAAYMARLGPVRCYAPDNAGLLEKKRVERTAEDGGIYWHYEYRFIHDSIQ